MSLMQSGEIFERFVKAWTDKIFHLETTVTSRIEGSHSTIKAYLQTSTGDLYQVCSTITLVITNQKKEIDAITASEQIYILAFVHNNALYTNLQGKVSSFALNKINEQYQKANNATAQEPLPPCTRSFARTMGLPCAHDIQNMRNKHPPTPQIDDNNFHHKDSLQPLLQILERRYHEWSEHQQIAICKTLNNIIDASLTVLQNPQVVRTKGCPSGAPNRQQTNTTRRDPSGFELVEHKVRQYSCCNQPGHNAHTCLTRNSME
ncbi:7322_t:CDS:2 [Cetraspora pellucida]|uniref:7322_t:CDS:1 n=1 Tax=Cetraspora pellucida TaxID=1433469 RepID=A0ACA9KQ59_9GLOM|nr:7322_t:CDS:2 [Cetraspora pellucida]